MLDRTGKKYGPWKVVKFVRKEVSSGKSSSVWLCKCKCGKKQEILANRFYHPPVCSCGINKKRKPVIHGKSRSRIYVIWSSMKTRCLCASHPSYERYGARGITVCKDWLSFESFYKDIGNPPKGMTLDRKDNSKGYSSNNCRWATLIQQSNNMRSNRLITHKGQTKTISEWARKTGLSKQCIAHRLNSNWPISAIFIKKNMRGTRKYVQHK